MKIPTLSDFLPSQKKLKDENHLLKMALTECLNIMEPAQWRIIGKALKDYNVLNKSESKFLNTLLENKERIKRKDYNQRNYKRPYKLGL